MPPFRSQRWLRVLGALALLGAAAAQEPSPRAAPRRLGVFLWHDSPNDLETVAGIEAALRAAGLACELVERRAGSDPAVARTALTELQQGGCELVFALGTQAALLAKEHLQKLPVVYAAVSNPVASGLVPTWDGSGSNLCGASNWIPPTTVLRVFRQAVPGLRRLGMLRSTTAGVVSAAELQTLRAHLSASGVPVLEVVEDAVGEAADLPKAVARLKAAGVQAIWVPIDFDVYRHMAAITAAVAGTGLPVLTTSLQAATDGAAVGVMVDYRLLGARAAALALEVLAGRRAPGAIPVDTLRSYRVVVNLAAARRAGYELPLSLLALADELLDEEAPGGRDAPR